jgi:hypothetical protein
MSRYEAQPCPAVFAGRQLAPKRWQDQRQSASASTPAPNTMRYQANSVKRWD